MSDTSAASPYLKMLDDFCKYGQVPDTTDIVPADKPWIHRRDPLRSFLVGLMGEEHYQLQVRNSKLRSRVFYSTVGKFVVECVHHASFLHKNSWTERDNMRKVMQWSDALRLDVAAVDKLLHDISGKYSAYGFDLQYFGQLLSGRGALDTDNWEKLVHDWQEAMDRHDRHTLEQYIESKKETFLTGLRKTMDQVTECVKANNINMRQAIEAWDMMDGQWTETEFMRRLRAVKVQDKYPQMGEIVARMGRTADQNGTQRLAVSSGVSMKIEHSSGSDIEGITIGDDINSLLPSEMAQFMDDDTESLFLYKYRTRRLQTFRYKSEMTTPSRQLSSIHASRKGPMIVCLDTSASMYGPPERIATALLAMIEQAAEELERDCYLIDFSVSVVPIDLMELNRQKRERQLYPSSQQAGNTKQRQKGAMPFIGGGTSARLMLDKMMELLDNEGNHYVNADVLWVTDFAIPMPEEQYLKRMSDYRNTGTRFYGLRIIPAEDDSKNTWEKLFDRIYEIRYRQVRRY